MVNAVFSCKPDLWQPLEAQLQAAAPSLTHALGRSKALSEKACMVLACYC